MQNENKSPATPRKKFLGLVITGTLLLVAGLLLFHDLWYLPSARWFPPRLQSLNIFSPVVIVLGGVMLLMSLFRALSCNRWAEKVAPVPARRRFARYWRVFIWLAVVFTLYPYWWLDILTRMKGERAGNEGEGMMGFLIIIFPGLPCLMLAILTEVFLFKNRDRTVK